MLKFIAIVSVPFALIWLAGLLTFPIILAWQIATYVNSEFLPSADLASMLSHIAKFFPVPNLAETLLHYIPKFTHDLHLSLILMGLPGLISAPGMIIINLMETAHDEAMKEIRRSIRIQE